MKKPFPTIAILVSLVFIGLTKTVPLNNSTHALLGSTTNSNTAKHVFFHYDNSNNHFIKGLPNSNYVAHRGAPVISNEPENSLPVFKAAKRLGFKVVETDLQLTKDGQWVIIHDYILDRTTNGKGTIKGQSLAHIEKLKLKDNKDENLSVPTLDELLNLCKSEELIPILDIKPDEKEISPENYDSLLTSLNKYNLLDKSIFTSSYKEVLSELRRRDNLTTIAVMMDATQDNLDFVKKLNNAFIYSNHKNLTDEQIDLINKNNLRFGVWTINDEKVAKHFLAKGAFMLVTDSLLRETQE